MAKINYEKDSGNTRGIIMNKKWIEFVEENTIWVWHKGMNCFYDHFLHNTAKPEDLLGHMIEFTRENGYDIISATFIKWKNFHMVQPLTL